jgi:hypothetical protein
VTSVCWSAGSDKVTVKLMLGSVPSVAGFGVPSEIDTVGAAALLIVTVKFCCADSEPSETVNIKFSVVGTVSALIVASFGTKV